MNSYDDADPSARVLVIDDTPIILDTFRLLLPEGSVETAATVPEALAKLEADDSLRILLVDLSMPEGGVPFVRRLVARYPDRAVIVMSGDAGAIRDKARELGIFGVLEKGDASYDGIEAMIAAASDFLKRRSGSATAAARGK